MVYYVFDSCHNYTANGGAEGWMVLKEEQGESMPEGSMVHNANGFTRTEYYSTYKEAEEIFRRNFSDYSRAKNQYIETHDMVMNDRYIINT
ncbi:MAG: hypothetical protein FWD26_00015 [Treponema sp.]|nr:hypothetical protein [Treponema sp.]